MVNACFTFGSTTSSTCDVNLNCEEEHSSDDAKQKKIGNVRLLSGRGAVATHNNVVFRVTPGVLSMCALCKRKLDEEKSKHVDLPQQNGF